MPLNSPIITGDVSGGLHSTSVDKLKGNAVAAVTPRDGEVLTWNGDAWVPGAPSNGGSGGGGVAFFLNGATAAQSPTTGLPGTPVELGRVADTALTTITSGTLSQSDYTLIKGFVSDVLDPGTTTIPAGLWDFNLWAASNANQSHQTIFRLQIFKYDGANAPTLLATSDDISIYDPTVPAQYIASVVVPQTTILATDRIYIEVQAKATANNRTVTIYTGEAKPSHVHTTIPSVTGTGLVKVVSSVIQSPASLLVNADVDANAAIDVSKINGALTTSSVIGIANGGTGQTTTEAAKRAVGGVQTVQSVYTISVAIASGGTVNLTTTASSPTVSYSNPSIPLAVGMSFGAGRINAAVIRSIDSGGGGIGTSGTLTMSTNASSTGSSTGDAVYTTNASWNGTTTPVFDGRTPVTGDIVILTNQVAAAVRGPWVVTNSGGPYTYTRPAWFFGSLTVPMLCNVQYGTAFSGAVVSVSAQAAITTGVTTIGVDSLSIFTSLPARTNTAQLGTNLFTGYQSFRANGASVNQAPFFFQTGAALMTTPQANAVEWFNDTLFLTTAAGVRTTNVVSTAIPATSTSAGIVGQTAIDNANNWFYVCTASNVWKRIALTTF